MLWGRWVLSELPCYGVLACLSDSQRVENTIRIKKQKECGNIELKKTPTIFPPSGVVGKVHLGKGRVHPWTSWQLKVPWQGSEGFLSPLMLPAPFPTYVRNWDLNQESLLFSAPRDWVTAAPTHLHIFWIWKATCQGETGPDHLSCGAPMYMDSVHEVGVVFNLISFQTWSKGGTEGWLRGWLKLDCLSPLL